MARVTARLLPLSSFVVALQACGAGDPTSGSTGSIDSAKSSRVIYGNDDRKDVFEVQGDVRELATRSIVAIVEADKLDESDPSNVRVLGESVGRSLGLCRSERFWDDPVVASCSGTLIADDLVLTAAHCLGSGMMAHSALGAARACKARRFVFGYYKDSARAMHPITSSDVFACEEPVVFKKQGAVVGFARVDLDFAVVRLSRSATPRFSPVTLRPAADRLAASPLTVLGFPSGMPLKIAESGKVTAVRSEGDFFNATVDTFAGNSGSGIFDSKTLEQVGVLLGGEPDYERNGSCSVVARCGEGGCDGKRSERVHQLALVLDMYCANKDAKKELCAR